MAIQSARFILENNWDDQTEVQQQLSDASIIFTGEQGCGWCIEKRIDDNHIQVAIWTSPEIMEVVMSDPRLELVAKLEGWNDEVE